MHIYIYIYMYICICIYIYINKHIFKFHVMVIHLKISFYNTSENLILLSEKIKSDNLLWLCTFFPHHYQFYDHYALQNSHRHWTRNDEYTHIVFLWKSHFIVCLFDYYLSLSLSLWTRTSASLPPLNETTHLCGLYNRKAQPRTSCSCETGLSYSFSVPTLDFFFLFSLPSLNETTHLVQTVWQ